MQTSPILRPKPRYRGTPHEIGASFAGLITAIAPPTREAVTLDLGAALRDEARTGDGAPAYLIQVAAGGCAALLRALREYSEFIAPVSHRAAAARAAHHMEH